MIKFNKNEEEFEYYPPFEREYLFKDFGGEEIVAKQIAYKEGEVLATYAESGWTMAVDSVTGDVIKPEKEKIPGGIILRIYMQRPKEKDHNMGPRL